MPLTEPNLYETFVEFIADRSHLTIDARTEAKDTKFSSKAYGNRENKTINMEGRLQLDMLQVMQRDYKLRSYTLNSVCAQFLGNISEEKRGATYT